MSRVPSSGHTRPQVAPSPWEKIAAFAFGVMFVATLLVLAVAFPQPTPFQYHIFRIVLALACGGVAAVIPGFLAVRMDKKGLVIRAGGALAVFLLVYFFNPAQLVTAASVAVHQETHGPQSPAISGVQGDVTIIQEKKPTP